jgi:hypothetical protein
MNQTDEAIVTAANKKLNRKFIFCWAITATIYFLCLLFDGLAENISLWTAKYIPSISKLTVKPSPLNGFTGKFLGVACLLMPIFLITYIWREKILLRFKYFQPKTGRGLTETLIVGYLLGLPLVGLIFFIFYAAPIDIPADPRLSGQLVLHAMLNTHSGLFVFGTLLITLLPAIAAIAIAYIWLPFSAAIHHFLNKEIK